MVQEDETFLWHALLHQHSNHSHPLASIPTQAPQRGQAASASLAGAVTSQSDLSSTAQSANAPDWSSFLPVDLITSPSGLQRLQALLELLKDCNGPPTSGAASILTASPGCTGMVSMAGSAWPSSQCPLAGLCHAAGAKSQLMQLQAGLKQQLQDAGDALTCPSSETLLPASDMGSSLNGATNCPSALVSKSAKAGGRQLEAQVPSAAQVSARLSRGTYEVHSQPRTAHAVGSRLRLQQQQTCLKVVSELLAPTCRSAKQD